MHTVRSRLMLNASLIKRLLQSLLRCLLVIGVSRLVQAQDSDDDSLFERNNTESLFPTVIDLASSSPTGSPTAPTASPSSPPTDIASESPTNFPTPSPTPYPTTTVAPSENPTTTFRPSDSPTVSPAPSVSPQPSSSPSDSPSDSPSAKPSPGPTQQPTISLEPTISLAPTITPVPTISTAPSAFPSEFPSDNPSTAPTLSLAPSATPSAAPSPDPTVSQEPSLEPTISSSPTISMMPSPAPTGTPSSRPTDAPSHSPTTAPPSPSPSANPTDSPSIAPSTSPTMAPTSMPTLTIYSVVQTNIYMYLDGLSGRMNSDEVQQWVDTTQNHVWRYYDEVNEVVPGIVPVNVSRVHGTLVINQEFTSRGNGLGTLEIEYVQAIDYGLFDPDADVEVLERQMFVDPFQYDAQSYIVDLISLWNLDEWVRIKGVFMGDTEPPTMAPTPAPRPRPSGPDLSRRQLRAISSCTVLGAILIVTALFWDRHRKEKMYLQTHAHDFENMEFDNTGQPVDWRNPYSPTSNMNGGSPHTQPDTPSPPQARSNSPNTTGSSTVVAATPSAAGSSRHSRGISLPALGIGRGSSRSSANASNAVMTPPPPMPLDHARLVSVADTDITDLTFSDGGGGGRSERDSDGAGEAPKVPTLPTISDGYGHAPWSPLHIPEEDPYGTSQDEEDSNMAEDLAATSNNKFGNTMTRFGMQVEELE